MSRDIRSFFTVKSKTSTSGSKPKEPEKNVKRKVNKIDSDSDEEVFKPSTSKKLKKESPKKELKEIDSKQLEDLFGVIPQFKKLKKTKEENKKDDTSKDPSKNKITSSSKENPHKSDKDKTHESVTEQNQKTNNEKAQKTENEQIHKSDKKKSPKLVKERTPKLEKEKTSKSEKERSPKLEKEKTQKSEKESSPKLDNEKTEKSEKEKDEKKINEKPEKNIDDISEQDNSNETILPNSAKKNNSANYLRYLARGKPKNLGNKIIPEGRPGCLAGLTFVITGVLDSLEREEAAELIKKYDGRVTQSVSKNTSFILIGEEAGESKLNKAKNLGTKQITEDELLEKIKLSKEKENSPVAENSIKSKSSQKKKETLTPKQKKVKPIIQASTSQTEKKIEDNKANKESSKPSLLEEKKCEMVPQSSLVNDSPCNQLWVEKYKPSSLTQLIGPKTEKSNPKKLFKWLQDWHKNNKSSGKNSKSPFNDMAMKAALLSGSPGIGKTTTAHLVCKELNYDVVEFNASDTRSQRLLREQVEELLSSKSISNFGRDKNSYRNKALIMDEVDGMAGNEDRGGVAELINLIKHTKIPIICICNDRQHPKIRSLVHYCLDLRFYKINIEPIRSAMMSICFKEKININAKALDQIIMATNHDIRQTLHNLSLWSSAGKAISVEDAEKESARNKKSLKVGPWDVARKIFSSSENLSLIDKNDLFFQDYDLGPLFIQENYLHVQPDHSKGNVRKTLDSIALTAESISMGDIIDKQIRTYNRWSLLPLKGIHSTIIPSHHMSGRIGNMINFPSFFGKNSKRVKFYRILKELQYHTQLKVSGNLESFNLDYAQPLKDRIYNLLFKEKMDGVKPCLDFMLEYNILRSDIENLIEVTSWDSKDLWPTIDSKVKAALTREFNKSSSLIPFSISTDVKKKRKSPEEFDENDEEEEEEEIQDDNSKLKLDPMIKERKRKAPAAQAKEPSAAKKRKVTNKKK